MRSLLLLLALPALAFAVETSEAPPPPEDLGPEVLVEPILRAELGTGIVVEAEIVDPHGVFDPKLFFRPIGDTRYLSIGMLPTGQPNRYRGEIPGTSVVAPMEYFIEAYDKLGNGPGRSAPATRPHQIFVGTAEVDTSTEARAPDILHQPVTRAPVGQSITIEAAFRGPSGLFNPVVYFRRVGTPAFLPLSMAELPVGASAPRAASEKVLAGAAGTGRFVAEIPSALTTGDIEYFIEVMDDQGNGPSRNGDRERPLVVRTYEAKPDDVRVDPDVALVSCLELPRENDTIDVSKLGACRRPVEGLAPAALTRFKLGELKLRYDNDVDAIEAFEQATKDAPSWPAAWFRLGQALELGREWKRARAAYGRYLELVGEPPEFPALIKRLASIEYEIDLEARDAREAAKKDEAVRAEADRKLAAQQAEALEENARVRRQMLLSAPGHWAYIGLSHERWDFSQLSDRAGDTEEGLHLSFRLRFKIPSAPFLVLGGAVSLGALATPSDLNAALAVAPMVGLNFLALPAPARSGFTLLSPFVTYQPRFLLAGAVASAQGSRVTHLLTIGNHFEFGAVSVEVAYAFSPVDSRLERVLELSVGRRFGKSR